MSHPAFQGAVGRSQSTVQNLAARNPTPILRSIPFPIDQILAATPPAARIQNPTHGVGRFVIDDPRRRRGRGRGRRGWKQRTDENRLNEGDVESGMDLESAGQFEVDGYRVYHLFNDKRANKLRGQFLRVSLECQIFGGKPPRCMWVLGCVCCWSGACTALRL